MPVVMIHSVEELRRSRCPLPSRLCHRINPLQSVTVPMTNTGPTVDPSTLTAIAAACRDSHRLRFDYYPHDGTSSVRTTEPTGWCTRAALVPHRLGRRPRRLAHVPGGPPRSTHAHRPAVHPAHSAGPRPQRVHLAGDLHVGVLLSGPVPASRPSPPSSPRPPTPDPPAHSRHALSAGPGHARGGGRCGDEAGNVDHRNERAGPAAPAQEKPIS